MIIIAVSSSYVSPWAMCSSSIGSLPPASARFAHAGSNASRRRAASSEGRRVVQRRAVVGADRVRGRRLNERHHRVVGGRARAPPPRGADVEAVHESGRADGTHRISLRLAVAQSLTLNLPSP